MRVQVISQNALSTTNLFHVLLLMQESVGECCCMFKRKNSIFVHTVLVSNNRLNCCVKVSSPSFIRLKYNNQPIEKTIMWYVMSIKLGSFSYRGQIHISLIQVEYFQKLRFGHFENVFYIFLISQTMTL